MNTYSIEQVIYILKKADSNFKGVFFIKRKNEETIYISKKDDKILCFNSHFNLKIDEDTFLENFKEEKFYFYENNEVFDDEKMIDKYYRQ